MDSSNLPRRTKEGQAKSLQAKVGLSDDGERRQFGGNAKDTTKRSSRHTPATFLGKAGVPAVRKPLLAPGSRAPLAFRDGPRRLSGLLERSARMNLRPLREPKNALTVIFTGMCHPRCDAVPRPQRERPIKA
jgi:hypothetical protein